MKRIIETFIKTALFITIIISSMLALIIHYKGESFDPVREIQLLISQERRDEARDMAEFFSHSQESSPEIERLNQKLRYTTLGKIKSFLWDGVIKGEVTDTYSGIGALGSDMVVLGDMRDLGIESLHYIRDDPDFDLVLLGLSLSGLVLSASPFVKKIKVPGIDLAFGELIYTLCKHLGRYGLIFHDRYGAFQVKYRFNDKARTDLIRFSAAALKGAAINNREELFNLNYPGIGNGGLKEYEVRPILEVLPENVCVWKKKEVYYGIYP